MTETIPAYEVDPYRQSCEATVAAVRGDSLVLDDTVLFPEGGGQPSDHGTLTSAQRLSVQVRSARGADGSLLHQPLSDGGDLEKNFAVGDQVTVELAWSRRYDHMQQHSAQHLLSALAEDSFGWRTTSFHLGSERCDIELHTPSIAASALTQLEAEVNFRIRQALPVRGRRVSLQEYDELASSTAIRSRGLPESHRGSVRLVEIEGVDLNTCGGTHVGSTAELQVIKLLDTESMRGGTRLHWLAGERVVQQFAQREERLAELRRIFETGDDDLVEIAQQRLQAAVEGRRLVRSLEQELAGLWVDRLAAGFADGDGLLEAHFDGRPMSFLSSIAKGLLDQVGTKAARVGGVALLTGSHDDKCPFVLVQLHEDVKLAALGETLIEVVGGRGGGRAPFFQGVADSWSERQVLVERLSASRH